VTAERGSRTQAQRTAHTRRVLLDAAFDALVQGGLRAVTTTEVAHRAGLSLGALTHQFPTKAELLTAAVVHSFDRRIDEFRSAMRELDPSADRIDAAIDLLWSMFSKPTFVAWRELWTAARTDPGLADAVIRIDREFMAASEQIYVELLAVTGAVGGASDGLVGLHLIYALIGGLATSRAIPGYEPHPTEAVLDAFKQIIRPVFGGTRPAVADAP
jgi:AcrR family transcriptional regulator